MAARLAALGQALNFTHLRKGMRARVTSVGTGGTTDAQRLAEMGLVEGTEFTVVKVAPFGDPIEIKLRGYRLCLRKHETAHIGIELAQ